MTRYISHRVEKHWRPHIPGTNQRSQPWIEGICHTCGFAVWYYAAHVAEGEELICWECLKAGEDPGQWMPDDA